MVCLVVGRSVVRVLQIAADERRRAGRRQAAVRTAGVHLAVGLQDHVSES